AKAKIKTDKRDCWMLAHLLRTDLIPEVYKRSRENRESQRVLRQRAFYMGSITRVKIEFMRFSLSSQKMSRKRSLE
ncbi:MAG: IS110 family transposase, partial [Candidatus Aminicenantes bacterium]|nr:IS110 family transposase [Candidatus Aminicenantes bacterium]